METTTTTATQAAVPAGLRPTPQPPVPAQPLGTLAPITLHWFQKDAVAAAVREVRNGGRATLVLATGSGKTLIAANCARRLAARGRVLVLVPTIELLEQTAESWSLLGGRRGVAVAACSRQEALESAEAGGRIEAAVTTQAPRIADLVASAKAGEPVTVYATYASMERITAAHQLHGLPAWDLVVIDEAHRTAGAEGRPGRPSTTTRRSRRSAACTSPPPRGSPTTARRRPACPTSPPTARSCPPCAPWTRRRSTARPASPGPSDRASSTATSPTTASWSPSSPTRTCANSSTSPPSPTSAPSAATRNSSGWPCRSRCCARSPTSACAGSSPSTPG
ncbi:DEAD/DEAH box helicase [Kitasatospora paranensis]|uniref:DEAD/DEAH box helicase n=1 Tax=Kitasatospora paranensis TaxID=258053 RepID=UPI0031EF4182